ncbi:flavin reductase family protein [Sneathiella aquimaris]|uniref:flavin reductase family protein n=1 Tax=Sneathiella aquimaris TaxID=2599305 RepID=UPI00146C5F42|nr:flavin reductase family protein [Sneathiella aquimaris]
MHQEIEPAVLYVGTPVVLVSTMNEDETPNLSPMSSAWWLGWSCMMGFDASSKTVENLLRTKECVLNLPSVNEVSNVDRLARLTGSNPIPVHKNRMGYQFKPNKFEIAKLTPEPAVSVGAPRVQECPIQLEATLVNSHEFAANDPKMLIETIAIEVRVTKVHVRTDILSETFENRIDPDKWKPLLMSFLEFFSHGEKLQRSRLAELPEENWGGRKPSLRQATGEKSNCNK